MGEDSELAEGRDIDFFYNAKEGKDYSGSIVQAVAAQPNLELGAIVEHCWDSCRGMGHILMLTLLLPIAH